MKKLYLTSWIAVCALLLAACAAAGASSPLAGVLGELPGEAAAAADAADVRNETEQKDDSVGPKEAPAGDPTDPADPSVIIEKLPGVPADCPVTLPIGKPFHPPEPYPAEFPYPGNFWYGSEKLWLELPEDGTWGQLQYGEKVFVWRVGFDGSLENQPALALIGRRLDGPAPEARSDPPATNAYHEDFHWAMLHGFQVPTSGCWEITASYAEDTLTFVAWVP